MAVFKKGRLITYTMFCFLILSLILPIILPYRAQAYERMTVKVVSPVNGGTYKCNEIIAVHVEVEFSIPLNYTELTEITNIMIVSLWDPQVIRSLPFNRSNINPDGSQTAIYASAGQPPTELAPGEMLMELNRKGFLKLPNSPGTYSVVVQVKATEDYFPYSEEIKFKVIEPKNIDPQFIILLALICLAIITITSVLIVSRKKKAPNTAKKHPLKQQHLQKF